MFSRTTRSNATPNPIIASISIVAPTAATPLTTFQVYSSPLFNHTLNFNSHYYQVTVTLRRTSLGQFIAIHGVALNVCPTPGPG